HVHECHDVAGQTLDPERRLQVRHDLLHRALAIAAAHDRAGAAIELDHALGIQEHVRALRGLPLQPEAAPDDGPVGRGAHWLTPYRSAMASFICHSTSSLN